MKTRFNEDGRKKQSTVTRLTHFTNKFSIKNLLKLRYKKKLNPIIWFDTFNC